MKKRFHRFFMSAVVKWGPRKLCFHTIWFNKIVYKNFHGLKSTRLETVGFWKNKVKKYFSKIVDFQKISDRVLFSSFRIFHGNSSKLLLNKAKRLVNALTKSQVSNMNSYFYKNYFVEKVEAELFLTLF